MNNLAELKHSYTELTSRGTRVGLLGLGHYVLALGQELFNDIRLG